MEASNSHVGDLDRMSADLVRILGIAVSPLLQDFRRHYIDGFVKLQEYLVDFFG
jgi:hypothetical protein